MKDNRCGFLKAMAVSGLASGGLLARQNALGAEETPRAAGQDAPSGAAEFVGEAGTAGSVACGARPA